MEDEWPAFLAKYATVDKNLIIVGDLNFHLDSKSDRDAARFTSVLQSFGLRQHVQEPTHIRGHTLDVVITRDDSDIVSELQVTDPGVCDNHGHLTCDHYAVSFKSGTSSQAPLKKQVSFRKLRSIDIDSFREDIKLSPALHLSQGNVDELVNS